MYVLREMVVNDASSSWTILADTPRKTVARLLAKVILICSMKDEETEAEANRLIEDISDNISRTHKP